MIITALRRWALAIVLVVGAVVPAAAMDIERVVSPLGIEAWLVQDRLIPVVAVEFSFRGGTALDPEGKDGVTQMVADQMTEGVGDLDSQAFKAKLEDNVISIDFGAGQDTFTGSMKTLNTNRALAVELLRDALLRPRFDQADLERARGQVLASLSRSSEEPGTIANRTWSETSFPGHPYAHQSRGTPQTVPGLTVADLKAQHARLLGRDNLVVGVVGDITPDELGKLLDRVFGDLPAKAASSSVAIPEVTPQGGGRTIVVRRAIPQSLAIFGGPGLKRDDPDYFAATLMNYILGGGGFNSRLTLEVREKRGLAYSVGSYLSPMDHAGLIMGSVGSENARIGQSLDIIREQWVKMRDEGPTEHELADAKTYVDGSYPLNLTSTSRIARTLVQIQYDNLGIDYMDRRKQLINAVTMDDIKRVAQRLLDPAKLLVVVVGEPDGLVEPAALGR
jgi:zinc protease